MISPLKTHSRSSARVPFGPAIKSRSRQADQNVFPCRAPSKSCQKYAQMRDQSQHGRQINDSSIGQFLINLFPQSKRPRRGEFREQKSNRDCQFSMLPLGGLIANQFVQDLQFDQLIVDIGYTMLRRVFEGHACRNILIMLPLASQSKSGELPIDERPIPVPQDSHRGSPILHPKEISLVLLDGQVGQFDGEGRLVGVAVGVVSAQLEDNQEEEHQRLHSNRGQIINGDCVDSQQGHDQLGRAPLYLLQRLLMGSYQFQASSSFMEASLFALICLSVSEIISISYFLRLFHLIFVRYHSSIFCLQPYSSLWPFLISSSNYSSLDSCYSSSRWRESFWAFNFLPSSTILSTPSPIVSICFSKFSASSFSATAASSCPFNASNSSCCLALVDWIKNSKNSDRSAEFFLSICRSDSQLQMVISIYYSRERACCYNCWEVRDWLCVFQFGSKILLLLHSQFILLYPYGESPIIMVEQGGIGVPYNHGRIGIQTCPCNHGRIGIQTCPLFLRVLFGILIILLIKSTQMSCETANCPQYFFGYFGVASALVFANLGAAYGSAKAGVGICTMGVLKPDLIMKSVVPVVMAGILGIYGMIVAVIIVQRITPEKYTDKSAYAHLASGLCCGFSSLAAGLAIGIVGDAGVRANAQQDKIFVGMILILIFGEALALYGLIVSLILTSQ